MGRRPAKISREWTPPQGDHQPGVATAWRSLVGDSSWAGLLAETFLTDPDQAGISRVPARNGPPAALCGSARALANLATLGRGFQHVRFSPLPQGITCMPGGACSTDRMRRRRTPDGLSQRCILRSLPPTWPRPRRCGLVHLARTGDRASKRTWPAEQPAGGAGQHVPQMPHHEAGALLPSLPDASFPPNADCDREGYELGTRVGETTIATPSSGAPGDAGSSRRSRNRFQSGHPDFAVPPIALCRFASQFWRFCEEWVKSALVAEE